MNSFFNAKKIIASLMVTAITLSSVSNTAYGAQTKKLATTTIETAVSVETLSIQEKLKLYVDTTKKQYENYILLKDYRFFDPEKYLLNNPDVVAAAEQLKAKDLNSFALTHYLYFGIFEGRSSQTPFDPIVALVSDSDIFNKLLISRIFTPENVFTYYFEKTGKDSTQGLILTFDATHTLLAIPDPKLTASAVQYDGGSSGGGSSSGSGSSGGSQSTQGSSQASDSTTSSEAENINQIIPTGRNYELINSKAEKIKGYTLSSNGTTADSGLKVTFYDSNYSKARKLAEGKNYTFMIYMCGTDQERNNNYKRVTAQIMSLLKGDMSNVNVLLCVGGTTSYANKYLQNDVSDLRCGIYYINPAGVSTEGKEVLDSFQLGNKSTLSAKFNKVINENTLIKLATTGAPIDMGDPGLLAGFIDFGTNLFPAADYGLSLSNHGGGLETGICSSDSLIKNGRIVVNGTSITTNELESALDSTDLYMDETANADGKLGLLFMDACLEGSTELANNLRDYYRFMIASEEITMNWTDYESLINKLNTAVKNNNSDQNIAMAIAEDFGNTPWHRGKNNGQMSSIVAYSSDAIAESYRRINALSDQLSTVFTSNYYSNQLREQLFIELRKSILSCHIAAGTCDEDNLKNMISGNSYVDIGEFMIFLNKNVGNLLTSQAGLTAADISALNEISARINNVLNSGFLVYLSIDNFKGAGGYEFSNNAPGQIITMANLSEYAPSGWTKIRGNNDYLYGSSLYIPFGMSESEFLQGEFYKYYHGSELNPYVDFVHNYLSYYNDSVNGYAKKRIALANELNDNFSKLVKPASDFMTLEDENGNVTRKFISFDIASSYEAAGLATPANSTGSPMLDILETQGSIQVSAVRKEYFPTKDNQGTVVVDMICAEEDVSRYSYALDSNRIYFNVSDLADSVIHGYALSGTLFDKSTGEIKTDERGKSVTDWQFVLKSSAEKNIDKKVELLRSAGADSESLTTDYITVLGGTIAENNQGTSSKADAEYINTYHIFKTYDDETYTYWASVGEDQTIGYYKIENVAGISVYHYILVEEDVEGSDEKVLNKRCLEAFKGIDDGYFSTERKMEIFRAVVAESLQDDLRSSEGNGYTLDIGATNKDYSAIAKVNETVYEGAGNSGNGPLFVDDASKVDERILEKDIKPGDYGDDEGETPEKYEETIDITNNEELDTVTEAESESKPEAKEDFEHEEALEPEFQQDSESEQASDEADSDADSDTETGLTKEN